MPDMQAAQGSLRDNPTAAGGLFHSGKTAGVNVADNRPWFQAYAWVRQS